MSHDQRDGNLPPRLRGGVVLPKAAPGRPSLWERVKRLSTRARTIVALVGTVLIGALALVGDSLDLWERTFGTAGDGFIAITHRTDRPDRLPRAFDDSPRWDDGKTQCRDPIFNRPPTLTEQASGSIEEYSPSPGEVGFDQRSRAALPTGMWVHDDVVDIAPESFSIDGFEALGAYHVGDLDVRILLANRTDEELVITGISLAVERRGVPTGTLAHLLGGDPVELTVLSFDLNDPTPVAYGIDDDCERGQPFFDAYVIEVPPRASEVVLVRIRPGDCLCLVRAHVEYWHAGQLREQVVPPADQEPFTVVTGGPGYEYDLVYVTAPGTPTERHDCRRPPLSEFC